MKFRCISIVTVCLLVTATAHGQQIEDKSYRDLEGNLILKMEMTVPANQREAWKLWSTDRGVSSWMAPIVKIDLRVGGIWEASYDPANPIGHPDNIQNEILSYVPFSMIAMRVVSVPRNYPLDVQKVTQTHTVVLIELVTERSSKITVCGVGYKEGPEWEAIYQAGQESTKQILEIFFRRCTQGPTIWPKPRGSFVE